MIEMRLLEILSAFAETGTQAAAAEKLHISQPTLSTAMRQLELEIGVPLFVRTKNRMSLNENGKTAAEYANRILAEGMKMRSHLQEMERKNHTISLATCSTSALSRMTMLITQAFPEKQLTTAFCSESDEMIHELNQERFTFIITDFPVMDEHYYGFQCYVEHLVALIPDDQPESGQSSVSLEELRIHQMLGFSNGGAWDRYIRRKLGDDGFIPQTNFSDYCSLINNLPVWAFASDTYVNSLSVPPRHKAVPVSEEDAHLDYWCSCLKKNKKEADRLRSFL